DGFMVSIGARYGVAFLMDKYHMSVFMAMAVKHMVKLLYFFTIRSFFYMGSYVRHELFDIHNKINIFGGHTSGKLNLLWSVPMRLLYGSVWLFEGIKKDFGLFGTTSWFGDQVVFPFP
ncbi:NADH dehydrogenase FAD-containing subunit, partial [Streptococcus suis]